jgi:hypothetical protein
MHRLHVGLTFPSVFSADIFTNIRLLLLLIKIALGYCPLYNLLSHYIFRELKLHVVGYHLYNSSFPSFLSCQN